jgi:hypothetical protein
MTRYAGLRSFKKLLSGLANRATSCLYGYGLSQTMIYILENAATTHPRERDVPGHYMHDVEFNLVAGHQDRQPDNYRATIKCSW